MSKAIAKDMDEAIGALIRATRLKKGIGQSDLAEALGVTLMAVQHWETGRNSLTIPKLVKIAEALGCKTSDLMP